MTSVLKALALYNNEAEDSDELSFKINDLLVVLKENWQDGWHLCQVVIANKMKSLYCCNFNLFSSVHIIIIMILVFYWLVYLNSWSSFQLGDKKGVAPSNYLQILVKPMNPNQNEESIYDCPKSHNQQSNVYINNSSVKSPVDGVKYSTVHS